ncbi:chemotaxis protein CheW [Sphingomonas phyllosphaerae]|jgi:purine-binding chemotaxis protein CheW|uniref:chemotaxis protein CheW n=1 Tax=Sphingomonas phyllosphaerae TaxID=257003 RepID=UPI0003B2F48A|nr:chemotaxis protein CheW [Sphingomonas phyllosphaerae]
MAAHQLITFQLGDQCLGVNIMAIREIRAWTPATPLPNVPAYMKGVVNLRGVVLPVLDLRHRLNWGSTEPTARHVIIVVQVGQQQLGLIVDAVNDIVTIDGADVQPVPEGTGDTPDFLTGLADHGGTMVLMLSLDALGHTAELREAA